MRERIGALSMRRKMQVVAMAARRRKRRVNLNAEEEEEEVAMNLRVHQCLKWASSSSSSSNTLIPPCLNDDHALNTSGDGAVSSTVAEIW